MFVNVEVIFLTFLMNFLTFLATVNATQCSSLEEMVFLNKDVTPGKMLKFKSGCGMAQP